MIIELGFVDVTSAARTALDEAGQTADEFLLRHANGDWGEFGTTFRPDIELKEGFRIFSSYILATGAKIWIFTEDDRSVTKILLPDEL
jgi:hypothetical protein